MRVHNKTSGFTAWCCHLLSAVFTINDNLKPIACVMEVDSVSDKPYYYKGILVSKIIQDCNI